jgi:hypothetical protein
VADNGKISGFLHRLAVKDDLVVHPFFIDGIAKHILIIDQVEVEPHTAGDTMVFHQIGHAYQKKSIETGVYIDWGTGI